MQTREDAFTVAIRVQTPENVAFWMRLNAPSCVPRKRSETHFEPQKWLHGLYQTIHSLLII